MTGASGSLQELFLVSSGVSAVSGLASSVNQANAQRAQGGYENDVAGRNARYSEMQAADALRRGEMDASQYSARLRQLAGSQRAAAAASGVDPDAGSAADIQEDSAKLGALDLLNIRNNAAREVYGYQTQADEQRASGRMARTMGRQNARASILQGGLSFLRQAGETAYFANAMKGPGVKMGSPGGKNMSDPRNR